MVPQDRHDELLEFADEDEFDAVMNERALKYDTNNTENADD